jgi:hypothetical protein
MNSRLPSPFWFAFVGAASLLGQDGGTHSSVPATVVSAASAAATSVSAPPNATVVAATPQSAEPPAAGDEARIVNLSTRARVTVENPLIVGFAIRGAEPRQVLVRGVGPTLASFGIAAPLAAPRLQVLAADGRVLADTTSWSAGANAGAEVLETGTRSGAFPLGSPRDAAAVLSLPPGNYTLHLTASDNGSGVALAEVYDGENRADGSHLANVSSRTLVAPGGGELISGFVLAGTAPRQFLVRGVGPALESLSVTGVLSNPVLAVFDLAGRQLATNDNWSGLGPVATTAGGSVAVAATLPATTANDAANAADVARATGKVGAFPLANYSTDAALVTTLAPGAYTVQVRGADLFQAEAITLPPVAPTQTIGTPAVATPAATSVTRVPAAPGVALLEIYEVP